MKVLVSDTSVLIDLDRGNLVEATFRLPVAGSCGGFGSGWKKAQPGLARKAEQRLRRLPMR